MSDKQVLVIIDADSLVYQSSKNTLEDSISILNEKIENIFEQTKATHYTMFLSPKKTFRHGIDPQYKANRKKSPSQLKWLKTLKSYLIEEWGANLAWDVESDDLCAYWYNKEFKIYNEQIVTKEIFPDNFLFKDQVISVENVLSTPDKDLLQSIPGKHFNYSYKLPDKEDLNSLIKGWWIETSWEEANVNFWKSMITGDATDNIKGIPGRGKVYADKLLKEVNHPSIQNIIHSEYQLKYGQSQGIYEFQKNYRLLHLLENDEDFIREVGQVPSLPLIHEVKKEVKEEPVELF